MKTTSSLFLGLLAATSVLGAPGTAKRRANHNKRSVGAHKSGLFHKSNATEASNGPDGIMTEYSTNWAGAALTTTKVTEVTGKFTVPTVSLPSGGSKQTSYSASAWVGIDGFTCDSSILQTGVDFTLQDGETTYDAWYEWYPAYAYDFSGISFAAGDVVIVTVKATSTTAGTATIENETTGKTVTHSFSSESDALCEYNAEWIVEDYEEDDSLVDLVDFGTVTFTDATAVVNGVTTGPSSATLIDMETEQGSIEAEASIGTDEVVVKYV